MDLEEICRFASARTCAALREAYPTGAAWLWGATPSGRTAWSRIRPGDLVAFSRDKRIFLAADVTLAAREEALASHLWGRKVNGDTWEYVFFITMPRPLDINVSDVNETVGYAPGNVLQGFTVLTQAKSDSFIDRFGDATGLDARAQLSTQRSAPSYRRADETIVSEPRTPFDVDPDVVDRGLHAHRALQNAIADFAVASGLTPESPEGGPNFDVGWWEGETFVVVEVKSLSATNEVGQMRLGIGQVLDYAHHYESRGQSVRAVLAVEKEPDRHWFQLCAAHGIRLVWPGALEGALH